MKTITSSEYGICSSGEQIKIYSIENNKGLTAKIINYGAILAELYVPDKNGKLRNIVLGHPSLYAYETKRGYFGAFIGRFANRIKDSRFFLEGKEYSLKANNGNNHLHGCFEHSVFDAEIINDVLELSRLSPAFEEGFPGNLNVKVKYQLTDDNELIIDYFAETDETTLVNLTNHTYFNLNGDGNGTILNHVLQLNSEMYLESGPDLCPTGNILKTTSTALDFLSPHTIGERINNPELLPTRGYDHCMIIKNPSDWTSKLYSEESGIHLSMTSTQPALQLYSGNGIAGIEGKGGIIYEKHSGVALEPEAYPCSPNYPGFPSCILKPNEVYHHTITYRFSII